MIYIDNMGCVKRWFCEKSVFYKYFNFSSLARLNVHLEPTLLLGLDKMLEIKKQHQDERPQQIAIALYIICSILGPKWEGSKYSLTEKPF